MKPAIAFLGFCILPIFGCKFWLEPEATQPGKQPLIPATESKKVAKGHVRVTVRNIKSENQAWFQNCLNFELIEKSTFDVGCNKKKAGTKFLETATPYDFEVSKGEKVVLKFNFDTWLSASSCITYDACQNPYPNTPLHRTVDEKSKSVRCFKSGTSTYRLFYEDQPDDHHFLDADVRSKLVIQGTKAPAPKFDPAHPTSDVVYSKAVGVTWNTNDPIQSCIASKSTPEGNVQESVLQDCIGIDWQDLVVDIEATDSAITISGISDTSCTAL